MQTLLTAIVSYLIAAFLEPYKPRPVTTAAVARNLVTNALGLSARIPREKRDEERRKLREARGIHNDRDPTERVQVEHETLSIVVS